MKVQDQIRNKLVKIFLLFVVSVLIIACSNNNNLVKPLVSEQQKFKVKIENVLLSYKYLTYGVFNTPKGEVSVGSATPGKAYKFEFYTAEAHKLSFATMFVQSNDLFYAPQVKIIDRYTGGTAKEGNIISQIYLWYSGTEVNEVPTKAFNQAPDKSGANSGQAENGTIRKISNVKDGFTYPATSDKMKILLDYLGNSKFKLKNDVLTSIKTPLAPGVFIVYSEENLLFTENAADNKYGLEVLAEDGKSATLSAYLMNNAGIGSPLVPGVFAVHSSNLMPLFSENTSDKNGK